MRYHLFFIALLLLFLSCVDGNKKTIKQKKDSINQAKREDKPIEKKVEENKRELITNRNVRQRLLDYGKENPESMLLVKTDKGDIKIRLFEDTPLHRASFVLMAKNGCLNNTVFTRVVKDFMAQAGGTYDEEMVAKRNKIGRYTIPAEIKKHHYHKFGAIGAARSYKNNEEKRSSPFNFYFVEGSSYNEITLDKYEEINQYQYPPEHRHYYLNNKGAAHIDGQHTVFGEVIEGMGVISEITSVNKSSRDWPTTDIYIKEVIVLN